MSLDCYSHGTSTLNLSGYLHLNQHGLSMLQLVAALVWVEALVSGGEVSLEAPATHTLPGHSRPRVPVME